GAAANELAHGLFASEITPAEDGRDEAKSSWMAPLEIERDRDGLVLGEKPLLGYEPFASDLDLERRIRTQVPHPLGVRPPCRADDGFTGRGVVLQCHRNRLATLAALAAAVRDQQEGMAEEPAPAAVVERARQPHQDERDPARPSAQTE